MATVAKNFRIKNGLVVEGATATVNGEAVLTKSAGDTTYIQGLVGGVANSQAVANAIVLRDANASFAANVVTADLVGDVTGTVSDISNHDTDALAEGTTNKYFSNTLARDAFSAGTGITLSSGQISVTASTYDAYGSASTAQTNAQNYADGLASNYDASGSASTAQTNAQNYADGLASNYDASGSASTAQTNAQNYADGVANTAQTNAVTIAGEYTDEVVANLVGSAPELLNTLQELATALNDNPNVIADLQDVAAGKQDTLVAGTGIDIVGNNISVTASTYDAYGSAGTAQTNAQNYADGLASNYDSSGSASTAQTNAQNYADGLASNYDASGSASTAQTNAQTYADGVSNTAQTNAQNYADGLAGNYDSAGSAEAVANSLADHESLISNVHGVTGNVVGTSDTQDLSNKRFIDTVYFTDGVTISNEGEIAILSGSHEFEIQANLGDLGLKTVASNADVVITSESGDIVLSTASGDSYLGTASAGNEIATQSYADGAQTNAQNYADGLASNYDASGSAANAQAYAQSYADSLASNYDASGSASTAQTNAQNYADGLASNYDASGSASTAQTNAVTIAGEYTDEVVANLVGSAPELLNTLQELATALNDNPNVIADLQDVAAGKQDTLVAGTGIDITGNNISVTASTYDAYGAADTAQTNAQNYADSLDTDDVAQGNTNLYFTNALAVSAIEAVTPNFQSVDITWVRREEATWTDANTAGTFTAHTFGTHEGSVKYLVRVYNNGESQVSEVLVTTDSSNNIAVTEYAIIYTSENPLATITADWNAGSSEYRLRVTTANNNSEILVAATLVAYND